MSSARHHLVILCGASNLQLCLPIVLRGILARLPDQITVLCAAGCGRSYGIWAGLGHGFLHFPGITACGLWRQAEQFTAATPGLTVRALSMDIGNDIMYMIPPAELQSWLDTVLSRLNDLGVDRPAMTALPMARLQKISNWKYTCIRRLYGRKCSLNRQAALGRAEEMQAYLAARESEGRIRLLPARSEWFGFDHIHLRWLRRKTAVGCWLDALLGPTRSAPPPVGKSVLQLMRLPTAHAKLRRREVVHQQNGFQITERLQLFLY